MNCNFTNDDDSHEELTCKTVKAFSNLPHRENNK